MAGAYLALLAVSHRLRSPPPEPRPGDGPGRVAVPIVPRSDTGPAPGGPAELSLLRWPAPEGAGTRPPVVCLHGSPGSARNFERLGPRLAATGREVWALDLPGFGRSRGPVGGYSMLAHARALIAVLDELGVERAHLLGWSLGGGVALHASELAPERIASLSLVSSIGVQETEGSGSFAFEHAKYLVWLGAMEGLDWLVPHFGQLSFLLRAGRASALNFWRSDQRPLRAILERLESPTLILHGREDVLVPLRAAEISHELARSSRLVVLDANHFLPLLQVDELCAELEPFLARHDGGPCPEPRERVERAPARGLRRWEPSVLALGRALPWWLQFLVLALASAAAPRGAAAVAAAIVAAAQLDFGLVALALALGAFAGAVRRHRHRPVLWLNAPWAAWGWMLLTLLVSLLSGWLLERVLDCDPPRWLAPLGALALVLAARAWRLRQPRPSKLPPQTLG